MSALEVQSGTSKLITLKNNCVKWNTLGLNYFMSELHLLKRTGNEYLIRLTTSLEEAIYSTAFALNKILGACS